MLVSYLVLTVTVVALVFGIAFAILWSQYRVKGMSNLVADLTLDAWAGRVWAKGRRNWSPDDADMLCRRLRSNVKAGTSESRERLCRHILEHVAKRTNVADDWVKYAESCETVAEIADEAGHWRLAEYGWKRAVKVARGTTLEHCVAKAEFADLKSDELERRDSLSMPV